MTPDILITTFKDYKDSIEPFYELCQRKTKLEPDDTLVVALSNNEVIGVVRLCHENETFVLRTMQVHPDFQRKGLGSVILKSFNDLLNERQIQQTYCMPYEHLETFYGQIGFSKIRKEDAPGYLRERFENYVKSHPSEKVILMRRMNND